MKRSVNFNGMKKWRGTNASDLLATFRRLGMSDDEIKAKLDELVRQRTADGFKRSPNCTCDTQPHAPWCVDSRR